MSNDRQGPQPDLNVQVATEWHKAIEAAAARIRISIEDFQFISIWLFLTTLSRDPALRSVQPTAKPWSATSDKNLRAYLASFPSPGTPSSSETPNGNEPGFEEASVETFPELLTLLVGQQLAQGRSMEQLAGELGYKTPKLLEMFMDGRARVPLNKTYPLARALDIAPTDLFRQVLRQYWPADDETLDAVLGEPMTALEREILRKISP